jgi:tryptophanyl-tRNA synthetase
VITTLYIFVNRNAITGIAQDAKKLSKSVAVAEAKAKNFHVLKLKNIKKIHYFVKNGVLKNYLAQGIDVQKFVVIIKSIYVHLYAIECLIVENIIVISCAIKEIV